MENIKYIYVITHRGLGDWKKIQYAYQSRRKAYRVASQLKYGEVHRIKFIENKFVRSDFVPKKLRGSTRKKKKK